MKPNNTISKVILIDGNSLAYRAFYALPDTMRTTSGITTNAVYGFTTMLLKVLEEKPDFVAISFDRPEPTFRHKAYTEYKATRQKAPPTLHEQIPYVKEIAAAFDIPIFELVGFEADDVIGTLAKAAEKAGFAVTILSGDLDPLQLVNEQINVLSTRKGLTDTILYGEKEVAERYQGLKPDQLIDYKALKGDASDNIPGVPGVGEKTAIELLLEYQTLDNLYQNLAKIKKPALKEKLANNQHLAQMSKKLGTIVTDAPINIDFNLLKRKEIDWQKAIPLFEKFEFNSLVKKYSKGLNNYTPAEIVERKREELGKFNFRRIKNEADLTELINSLAKASAFAFDLETTGLDPFTVEIVGISFSDETKSAYYIATSDLPVNKIKAALTNCFLSNKIKIGHNLKYDLAVLSHAGFKVNGPFFDTMVAAYLLDPTAGKYGLKHLAKQFLGRDMIMLMELIGKDAEYANFAAVPTELATQYACSDAEATFSLYELFTLALKGQKLDPLAYEVEMPLVEVLTKIEETGVTVDVELLKQMSGEINKEQKELERHLFAIAGEVFNLNSPKQLAHILFTKLLLPIIKRTKTGPSTDAEVLEELAGQKFEIAQKLLEYRQLAKLKNTYVDVLPTLVKPQTGRIHTSFNQTITATGRLSSSEPNLQNIPARGEWGKRIRSVFIPGKKGWFLLSADYSQIELRILAHLSQDPEFIRAFQAGEDVHQATADELGITRAAAKTINFGIIYGISDFGLAKSLGIKKTEAAKYIEKYFQRHQGVKHFIEQTIKEARENGFVTTLLGRKRPLPDINSPNQGIRSAAERMAINTPVQGTAADMIKIAMVKIFHQLISDNFQAKMLLQVHDELVFESPEAELANLEKLVHKQMNQALTLTVPSEITVKIGANWSKD